MSSLDLSDEDFEVRSSDLKSDLSQSLMGYISDTPLAIEEPGKVEPKRKFPCAIIIANIPRVKKEKKDKLTSIISRVADPIATTGTMPSKYMPINAETGVSYGFMIVEYENEENADDAVIAFDNLALDTKNTFRCVKLDSIPSLLNTPDEMPPFKGPPRFTRQHFRDWMLDAKGREQLLLRYQDETEIYWQDPLQGTLELVYGGAREKKDKKLWCDSKVQWSPYGSYLMTFHKQGIALWGNDDFQKQVRFAHANCKYAMFSPHEEYLMTWNGTHPTEQDQKAVRFFNVLTGQEMKAFPTPTCNPTDKEFPQFLWNHSGKYIARSSEKDIRVFELPSFDQLKHEKSKGAWLPIEGISSFAWSPKDDILSVWVKERENVPARLSLIEVPSRKELASRSRTQCGAQMIWQSEGDYLCLNITKFSKTAKKESKKKGASVEIFRLRENNIPVESLELGDLVKGFFWETRGHRFALITEPETGNPRLTFYSLAGNKCAVVQEMELPSAAYNEVYWAPEGQYFIVAAIPGGDLLWGMLTPENRLEILYKDEHFMLNHVAWDPSSRYVITGVAQPMQQIGVSAMKYQMESGFCIWTFQGRLLYRQQKEKLYDMGWRPHPKSLLFKKEEDDTRKKLKDYSKKYDADDELGKEAARATQKKFREDKINEFSAVLHRIRSHFEPDKLRWETDLKTLDSMSPWETVLEKEQEVIEERTELMRRT